MKEIAVFVYVVNMPGYESNRLLDYLLKKVEGAEFYERVHNPEIVYNSTERWKMIIANAAVFAGLLSDLHDLLPTTENTSGTNITQQVVVNTEQGGGRATVIINNGGIVINDIATENINETLEELQRQLKESNEKLKAIRDSIGHPQREIDNVRSIKQSRGWKRIK